MMIPECVNGGAFGFDSAVFWILGDRAIVTFLDFGVFVGVIVPVREIALEFDVLGVLNEEVLLLSSIGVSPAGSVICQLDLGITYFAPFIPD